MAKNTGQALEDEVFRVVQSMVDAGDLPYRKELVKFRRKASYHSEVRKSEVNFENALEVFVRDNVDKKGAKPTHVIFFECKDHGRKVEVGQVEEMIGRLSGLYGFSMKAYIVTRNGFSKGALNTAASNGIGLMKLLPNEKIQFVLHFMTPGSLRDENDRFSQRTLTALLDSDYTSDGERFYGLDGKKCFHDMANMISYATKNI